MAEIKFEIHRKLGVLSQGTKGWQKEMNLVRWNDRAPKVDIRDWSPGQEKMGRGITLSKAEVIKLKELLDKIDLDELM